MSTDRADAPAAFWRALPEDLKALLRLGFMGKAHLLDVAARCLRPGRSDLAEVAGDALNILAADHPLDGGLAAELLAAEPAATLLAPDTVARLRVLAAHWVRPADMAPLLDLLNGRDFARTRAFLDQAVRDEPGNLFWREQAVTTGTVENDPDFVFACLKASAPEAAAPVLAAAEECTRTLFFPPEPPAPEELLAAARRSPWNAGLVLRAFDALSGAAGERSPLPGRTAVLLYSWNKADELDATLSSLLASDLAGVSVFVLDNGSTDGTAGVLDRFASRFADVIGADRFTVIPLRVNVGAAAARNWLLHLDAVREHDFCCYLDDDVDLPSDWLLRLGAAVRRYPEAGVWGCKVVDHANPLCIQSADNHLAMDPEARVDLSRTAPNPFSLTGLHVQTLDTGGFDFLRPCASVTGCCHLFRTRVLLESGDFAIQLSPSQYDDMEHDLRLCEAGLFPVYQGHLAVRHRKRTGAASLTSDQERGNALGNKYKMQTMHARADIAEALRAEQALLEADLTGKLDYLEGV
ncbi:Glycosyl transferase family 2 [Pseudodesulfovibrio hydrargyri]|uniref:Glycosyl transferase family 2 n=1 Tax=Pseudodesulfovibrio hydrargyri TaxID=2125990 RepID=A0A1J5MX37_9BACT|nr:glycosyltransferase family A protein [Pseudodesulfovibrio hydrargyri]OIQ50380.1 Glycosyl transferase family 2 [Pseudodesulfovibrio hydrargyri]